MKYKNLKNLLPMNIQFFAEPSGEAGDSDQEGNAGGDDQDGRKDPDEDGQEDDAEKKYTQADVDAAVEKRLAREKRKWQREQQQNSEKPDGKAKTGEGSKEESNVELDKERKQRMKLEMRLACYDAGVSKDSVKDVTALAKSYMEDDEDMDFEDAVEKVLKKYPQFKGNSEEAEGKGGAWGQRQKGKGAKNEKSLEDEISEALYGK